MYEAYRNATATIVAATSCSTADGIFSIRNLAPKCPMNWHKPEHERQAKTLQASEQAIEPIEQKVYIRAGGGQVLKNFLLESGARPLYIRGWTLQESFLSPRILSYETGQLIWQCLTLTAHGDGYTFNFLDNQNALYPNEQSSTVQWKQVLSGLSLGPTIIQA